MKILSFLFIFLSIWTDPFADVGLGVLGRIVPADIIGACMIFFFFVVLGRKIELNDLTKTSFILLLSFVPGLIVSLSTTSTFIELLILLFLILVFIVLYNFFNTEEGLKKLITYFAIASLTAAIIGLWNIISGIVGIPSIPVFNPRAVLVGIGTFRNTGQAGAYMGISLSILWAVRFSKIFNIFKKTEKRLIATAIPLCLLFLLATVKRAALIGFGFGLVLWVLLNLGRFRISRSTLYKLGAICLALGLSFYGFFYLFQANEDLRNQFLGKWVQSVPFIMDESSFMRTNYSAAISSFFNNPVTGSGIGGFSRYDDHEVHSTYLKLLGETGIIGVIGYLIFASSIFKKWKLRLPGIYGDFIRNLTPFFIGLFLSWGYTFHLRKREFWILLAIFAIAYKIASRKTRGLKQPGDKKFPLGELDNPPF